MKLESIVYAKAKLKLFLLYFLSVQLVELMKTIDKSDVAEYFIQRRMDNGDVFTVVFNPGCKKNCNPRDVSKWCVELSANFHSPGGPYSCSCIFPKTFLPELGKCVNKSAAAIHFKGLQHVGCAKYLTEDSPWSDLFLKTLDLGKNGSRAVYYQTSYGDCEVVSGLSLHYDQDLTARWDNISKEIFSFENNQLKWNADNDMKLFGRIIELNVRCNKTDKSLTGCLLFRVLGNITYCYLGSGFVQRSVCPIQMNTSTIMPSLLPSSSSSSFSMLQTTKTGQLTPVPSSYSSSQSDSISSTAPIPSSSHVPPTSRAEINSSIPVNPQETSSEVVSSSVYTPLVPPLKPSKSLPAAATSSPADKGPGGAGGADAQKGDGDNGAVIGAAVGGAVFFTIVVIAVVVFCKRRKKKPTKDKKMQRESTLKNPVYESADNDISMTPKRQSQGMHREMKNPVYESADNDISMTPKRQSQAMTSRDQHHPPVYQSPSKNNGLSTEQEVYENPESNYDNHPVYQSLDNKTAAAGHQPVYQSLQSGTTEPEHTYTKAEPSHAGKQTKPARPELGATDERRKRSSVNSGPVNKEPNPGGSKTADESLYNVLEGPDSDQDYEPIAGVVEGQGGVQEPMYNVLDGEATDGSHSEPEPVYNVLDGPDPGEYEDAAYAAPGGPIPGGPVPPRAIENPAYEVTQEFGAPEASQYALVERPGPQRESAYEPLRRPNREDT